jgi:circadian clock protein KaiB
MTSDREPAADRYVLRLFVTGTTVRSQHAIANMRHICDEFLSGRYELEVIDIYQEPEKTRELQIIATPTLVRFCRSRCGGL